MNYAVLIRQLREKMILSQTEFAERLGVSNVTVSRWETGKSFPTIKLKRKLNDLFLKYDIRGKQ
jgi:transcriptional regulator with XRE-family HTH domain